MSSNETLERKNEILRRTIDKFILKQNQSGLNRQDRSLMQQFIKELHHNNYSMR